MATRFPASTTGPKTQRRHPHGRTPAELFGNAPHKVTPADLDLHGVTILIVEDHEDSREMLRQIVESFGAKAAVAADGREALATAAWLRPELVFCDLRMPVLDGFAFIERLRHDPALSRTAVLAVTALGSDADVRKTWLAGFDGHLVKPVDYDTIAQQLERVFWAHRRKPKR